MWKCNAKLKWVEKSARKHQSKSNVKVQCDINVRGQQCSEASISAAYYVFEGQHASSFFAFSSIQGRINTFIFQVFLPQVLRPIGGNYRYNVGSCHRFWISCGLALPLCISFHLCIPYLHFAVFFHPLKTQQIQSQRLRRCMRSSRTQYKDLFVQFKYF